MRKNYTFELKPNAEDLSVQIFMPFALIWKDKEYNGTFLVSMSKNIGVEEYGIEWANEAPDFGEFETEIYEEIEEKLLEEIAKQYNIR